jgi:hypothetical protein
MTMRVHKQLLGLEHCWGISTWSWFNSAPYSPDLTLSDYHLFMYQKIWLGSQCLDSNEELMEDVKTCLSSQVADFFDTGIHKLIPQYHTCLSSGSDYVEK